MRAKKMTVICGTLIAMAIGASSVWAATQPAVQEVELNAAGQKLLARYSDQLQALQTHIEKALPKIDEKQKAAFLKAYQDEAAAMAAELNALRAQDRKPAGDPSKKDYETAKEALALTATKAQPVAKAMLADLEAFLASDKLDAKLAKYMVLAEATPRGLAEFAQQGKEQEALVETLLADDELMKQILRSNRSGRRRPRTET